MEDNQRHALMQVSLEWQPHPGEREAYVGRFEPAHLDRHRGGETHGG